MHLLHFISNSTYFFYNLHIHDPLLLRTIFLLNPHPSFCCTVQLVLFSFFSRSLLKFVQRLEIDTTARHPFLHHFLAIIFPIHYLCYHSLYVHIPVSFVSRTLLKFLQHMSTIIAAQNPRLHKLFSCHVSETLHMLHFTIQSSQE